MEEASWNWEDRSETKRYSEACKARLPKTLRV